MRLRWGKSEGLRKKSLEFPHPPLFSPKSSDQRIPLQPSRKQKLQSQSAKAGHWCKEVFFSFSLQRPHSIPVRRLLNRPRTWTDRPCSNSPSHYKPSRNRGWSSIPTKPPVYFIFPSNTQTRKYLPRENEFQNAWWLLCVSYICMHTSCWLDTFQ